MSELDTAELRYQHAKYRDETDGHFRSADRMRDDDDFTLARTAIGLGDDEARECLDMVSLRYDDAIDHVRRFVILSAKKMRLPASAREDLAQEALCEIIRDIGREQFELFAESVACSDRILEAFGESDRGLIARRAIKRTLARFKRPMLTFTDVGIYDEVSDGH